MYRMEVHWRKADENSLNVIFRETDKWNLYGTKLLTLIKRDFLQHGEFVCFIPHLSGAKAHELGSEADGMTNDEAKKAALELYLDKMAVAKNIISRTIDEVEDFAKGDE